MKPLKIMLFSFLLASGVFASIPRETMQELYASEAKSRVRKKFSTAVIHLVKIPYKPLYLQCKNACIPLRLAPGHLYFISSDPIGLNGGYNSFAYANVNPLFFTDPSGLKTAVIISDASAPFDTTYWQLYQANNSDLHIIQASSQDDAIQQLNTLSESGGQFDTLVISGHTDDPEMNWGGIGVMFGDGTSLSLNNLSLQEQANVKASLTDTPAILLTTCFSASTTEHQANLQSVSQTFNAAVLASTGTVGPGAPNSSPVAEAYLSIRQVIHNEPERQWSLVTPSGAVHSGLSGADAGDMFTSRVNNPPPK